MKKLKIFHDDNSVFTDLSEDLFDFSDVDTSTISLSSTEDYFYVGLDKPFTRVYVEFSSPNTVPNAFVGEYYNGTTYDFLPTFEDESRGFTRSGFISWDRESIQEAWTANEINSEEKFWIRFRPGADHSATTIKGLNLVFSNDHDLKEEFFEIDDFLPEGESTFILKHQASKKDIIQMTRNQGRNKSIKDSNGVNLKFINIDEWDFLLPFELRQASKYLTLHKIFNNISDDVEGKFQQLSQIYKNAFKSAFELFYLTLDEDDDGIIDVDERVANTRIEIIKV